VSEPGEPARDDHEYLGSKPGPDSEDLPDLIARLRERRAEHRRRRRAYRVVYVIAGFTVTAAGLAMLVLPGPALVVIPIGLAMLALEFAWAERVLERTIAQAELARRRAAETSRAQRILGGLATALGIGAAVAAALIWDIPLLPV
jgi:uncharacterized protein (TIGR02611 family)